MIVRITRIWHEEEEMDFAKFQAWLSDCATVTHLLGGCLVLPGGEGGKKQDTALTEGR